jgi:hypothetical protein
MRSLSRITGTLEFLSSGNVDAHGRTKASHGAVFEESVDDDGIADQVEPAVDRIAGQPLSRALVQLVEDRKLVIARDLFEVRLYAGLVAGCGGAAGLRAAVRS